VFFGIDHLVFAAERELDPGVVDPLEAVGFVPVPGRLRFDESGVHSHSLAYVGGGFIEFVYRVGPGAPDAWFAAGPVPRLIGIGVSSDDFEADTHGWEWRMDEQQVLDDGSMLRIHAAGPHPHLSPLYLFAMDRPDRLLDHPELGGTPALAALELSGAGASEWRTRLAAWLGRADAIGDVEIRVRETAAPGATASPVFRCGSRARVPLASGAIVLEP
jgi:hypothetical protein